MRKILQGVISNAPAINLIVIAVFALGLWNLSKMPRERFPTFSSDQIEVSIVFPNASPSEVERLVSQKVENAVVGIAGIKTVRSLSTEGLSVTLLKLESRVNDAYRVKDKVSENVSQIEGLPSQIDKPLISLVQAKKDVLRLGLLGPAGDDEKTKRRLRQFARRMRRELQTLTTVRSVTIVGESEPQLEIEVSPSKLKQYQLSLQIIADKIRKANLRLASGKIQNNHQVVTVETDNLMTANREIENIPILTTVGGMDITVGDLGTVKRDVENENFTSLIDGLPGVVLEIERQPRKDLLTLVEDLKNYVSNQRLPAGYRLFCWNDRSDDVRGRIQLLIRNGLQGLLLVFIVLAVFLEMRLAFRVAMGIAFSVFFCGIILNGSGQTLNMVSMFAMVMALGMVVDDAILVGESVYTLRENGTGTMASVVDGTMQVLPAVLAAVGTTAIALLPLLFIEGPMGEYMAVMPTVILIMLFASIVECLFILPSHLAHNDGLGMKLLQSIFYSVHWLLIPIRGIQSLVKMFLNFSINNVYRPWIRWCLKNRFLIALLLMAIVGVAVGLTRSGRLPFVLMPKMDSDLIVAKVVFPNGTSPDVTQRWTQHLADAFRRIQSEDRDVKEFRFIHQSIGFDNSISDSTKGHTPDASHVGIVEIQLQNSGRRTTHSDDLIARWRQEAGPIPGVQQLSFYSSRTGPAKADIELQLLADSQHVEKLRQAADVVKKQLAQMKGVFDVRDDWQPGKWNVRTHVTERAFSMGIQPVDVAETVASSFAGEEVMRLELDGEEHVVRVRHPKNHRVKIDDLKEIWVQNASGKELPLGEIANFTLHRPVSTIHRVRQQRALTIWANVQESQGNARQIVRQIKKNVLPKLSKEFPEVKPLWEGQARQSKEALGTLKSGSVIALFAMFTLLAFQLKSVVQPLIILLIIPFSLVGAFVGHVMFGAPITLFSIFGMVALSGVVVNDSIVLVDSINKCRDHADRSLQECLEEAGARRLRPILLTSLTTVAGLIPILMETSTQAQFLIPMAISLAFGLLFATPLLLIAVPVFYSLMEDASQLFSKMTCHGQRPVTKANRSVSTNST